MKEISIKICGITQEKDISAIVGFGIDFLGFVLVEGSSRYVSIKRLKRLLKAIPSPISSVALLVNPKDDILEQITNEVKIDFLQLHGQESPERVSEIAKKSGIPIIKAIGIRKKSDLKKIINYEEVVDYLLLDAKPESEQHLPGGNGIVFDWEILKDFNIKKPWFLAGGLNSENVSSAISIAGANMVDVSSGVEFEPGNKSIKKISSFVRSVNEYNK